MRPPAIERRLAAEGFLSPGEAARILGVSTKTVANLCDLGRIAAIRIGRQRRISRVSLREYAESKLREQD